MFRLQNNVPEVYVDKSRDFQLFCRLYDSCFNGVKFSTDSISRLSNTQLCDSRVLELLKTKLGVFISVDMDERELRYLLSSFPTLIRYKGSKKGVDYIRILYTKMYKNVMTPVVEYDNTSYQVKFIFAEQPPNIMLLVSLLKYVLPTGYLVTYEVARIQTHSDKITYFEDKVYYDRTESTDNPTVGVTTVNQSDIKIQNIED